MIDKVGGAIIKNKKILVQRKKNNRSDIGGFDDIAVFSDEPIHVQAYIAEVKGDITCKNEIKEAIWIDKDYEKQNIEVGSILGKFVIPELVKRGLM